MTPYGESSFLDGAGGAPLAAEAEAVPYPKEEVPFPSGATLLLYTDGLIERRGRSIDDGFAALADAVRRHAGLDVESLADAVLGEFGYDGTTLDDTALVIAGSTD